jgi:subtilisin family serine protease
VAPGASLVALKVFGCRGTTTFLTRAIDYAIDPNGDGNTDDRLVDVLNISLGSPFGGESDPDVVAINRAVDAGVVVVVAAGDTGGKTPQRSVCPLVRPGSVACSRFRKRCASQMRVTSRARCDSRQ